MHRLIPLALLALLGIFTSCSNEGAATNGDASSLPAPPDALPAYDGPPATFTAEVRDGSTQFKWSVVVPTGGWWLRFKGSTSDPETGHAIIKAWLIRPAPDEMVTQAFQTLSDEYTNSAKEFVSAELHIVISTRGEPVSENYMLAGTWP